VIWKKFFLAYGIIFEEILLLQNPGSQFFFSKNHRYNYCPALYTFIGISGIVKRSFP